jgi:hypothetical protein
MTPEQALTARSEGIIPPPIPTVISLPLTHLAGLTARELEVLRLMARGMTKQADCPTVSVQREPSSGLCHLSWTGLAVTHHILSKAGVAFMMPLLPSMSILCTGGIIGISSYTSNPLAS